MHIFRKIFTRTLVIELRGRAIKRLAPCGNMDRRLKILHTAMVECRFQTTPEECLGLYDNGLIGLQCTYGIGVLRKGLALPPPPKIG